MKYIACGIILLTVAVFAMAGVRGGGAVHAQGGDYDADNDGLIDIRNLARLGAIRYDLTGQGSPSADDRAAYYAAPAVLVR